MPTQTGSLDLKSGNDASKTATNYITEISTTDGIKVHNVSDTSNYAQINSSGMNVVQSGVSVASFGASARVGKESGGHATIQTSGMQIYGSDGTVSLANIGYGQVVGKSGTTTTPYYSLGARGQGDIGAYSFTAGDGNVASRPWAIAMGANCVASGVNTVALGSDAVANHPYQTAIGSANYDDESDTLFVVGNGDSGAYADRSNAFSIDWYANIKIGLCNQNSIDWTIDSLMTELGWDSDVIEVY